MPVTYLLKHGVEINTEFGVCIQDDAEFWSLPPNQALAILQEAREIVRYARDLAQIDWFRENDAGRMQFGMLETLTEGPDILRAMQEIDDNPLATEDEKDYAHYLLESLRAYNAKKSLRRAPHTSLRQKVIQRDGGKCRYCGKAVIGKVHIDHVVPYALGGKTELDNLVVTCADCNLRKGGRSLEEAGMSLISLQEI